MHTRKLQALRYAQWIAVWMLVGVLPMVAADTGKLRVWVNPPAADVFVDGHYMGDASWDGYMTVHNVGAGEHVVGVYAYGWVPQRYTVTIRAGKTTGLHVKLAWIGREVTGPWGRIQIKGEPHAAVLLNGKTPDYDVGHADMFDHELLTGREELLVHAGTYEVTLERGGQTLWSGSVTVQADQTTVVRVPGGQQTTEKWSGQAGSVPMWKVGMASARIAVEPVTGQFSAEPGAINCGESSKLNWSSTGAVEAEVSGNKVAATGSESVTPKATTTYNFTATGPGGKATGEATVTVNNPISASLEVTPQEVRYRSVGGKVVEQGSATLNWSTSGAETVTLDPYGTVQGSGSRVVTPTPKQTATGPVDETETYTLTATNACGASQTRTASLHVTGSVVTISEAAVTESTQELGLALASVFFPTAYPETERPEVGLVKSQQEALGKLGEAFKKYLQYEPSARLEVEAHADVRGSKRYNQGLAERRAARVKDYLVSQGVPASAIDTKSYGKEEELARGQVKELEAKNPNPPPKRRMREGYADWLAYNRRVDLTLQPAGMHSSQYYPHGAADSSLLWQVPRPRWRVIEKAQ
jgi:peptidoglycan-associated lipoprotein